MKKVLWVSRHEMTTAQKADLDRIMGGAVLVPMQETVRDIDVLRPLVAEVDAVAAVLPPELLADLLAIADGKPVLRAVSGRQATGQTVTLQDGRHEPEFAFVHVCWEQVLRVEILTRRL